MAYFWWPYWCAKYFGLFTHAWLTAEIFWACRAERRHFWLIQWGCQAQGGETGLFGKTGFQPCFNVPAITERLALHQQCLKLLVLTVLLNSGTFLTDMVGFLGSWRLEQDFSEKKTGFQPHFNFPASTEWLVLHLGCLKWVVLMVLLFPGTFLTDKVRFLGSQCWNGTFRESLTGFQSRFTFPSHGK